MSINPKPPLNTSNEIQHAVEDAWADLQTARHAIHYLLNEMEGEWTRGVDLMRKNKPIETMHTLDNLSARAWLAERIWTSIRDVDDALSHMINNIPDEVKPNA